MWYKAELMGNTMRQGYIIVIYKALWFDVAQGRMNGAPNETRLYYINLQNLLIRCGTRPIEWGTNETRLYYSNLQSSLLRCGTRLYEWGT